MSLEFPDPKDEPVKETCPYCGCTECEAEFVDIGVGFQQVTPYWCPDCEAAQINPYHVSEFELTPIEQRTRWHEPRPKEPLEVTKAATLDELRKMFA